jgi:hypothetical protein
MFTKTKASRLALRAVVLTIAAAVLLFAAGPASAKKPPKPPPDPEPPLDGGLIYYSESVAPSVPDAYTMKPDGSERTLLDYAPGSDPCEPSHAKHGGERWFLRTRNYPKDPPQYYTDGVRRRELYAVSESGTEVRLTDDSTLEPLRDFGFCARWATRGSIVDGKVSYVARRWEQDPDTGEWSVAYQGIHVLEVDPDALTSHVPAAPSFLANLPSTPRYDWSSDGQAVAFTDVLGDPGVLYVAEDDDAFATWTEIPTTSAAINPRWSPDGTRIAFQSGRGIERIDVDGENEKLLVGTTKKKKVYYPLWSPNGTHLVFWVTGLRGSPDVYRVTADGAGETNLTESNSASCFPNGWR